MKAALVSIGDEILIGQITDTNAVWLSQQLSDAGIQVNEMVSISDDPGHIISTLDRLIGSVELILMTGGLGPTRDDLTKDTLNDYFGGELVMHQPTLEMIEDFFKKRGRTLIESNRRQALIPSVCKPIRNERGTAPGMWFTEKGTHLFSMPGVPYEMMKMFSDEIFPELKNIMEIPVIVKKTIMTHGVPESYLAEMIKGWENALPECMKLAYLPRPGIVRLRLTVREECTEKSRELIDEKIESLKNLIGKHIFGYDDISLEKVVGNTLKINGLTISTAESCTGGNIARTLTSIPGSSAYFMGSVIAYSNENKNKILGVPNEMIMEHGAVSQEVVEEMAKGIRKVTGTNVSVATSGIAGPDGGTEDKPVGTTWIAVSKDDEIISRKFIFGGHRALVIEQASVMALGMVREVCG